MKKSFMLLFTISLIFLFALPAFCVVLHPSKSNPNKNQDIVYKWTPGMTIGFTGGSVSGYKYVGLISRTSIGSWTGDTWHPPLAAKSVTNICKGKWVPSGGEGEGEPPPILYCTAINKGKFPDKIEFVKPTEDKNIAPGDSVSLEITVKDQDGKAVSGHTIDWSVNQTGSYFSLAGGTGYTQEVSSSSATPPGTSCTVKATIKDTTISATSKKVAIPQIGAFTIDALRLWDIPNPLEYHIHVYKTGLTDSNGNEWDLSYPRVRYEWYNCWDGEYFPSGYLSAYTFGRIFTVGQQTAVRGYVYCENYSTEDEYSNSVVFYW